MEVTAPAMHVIQPGSSQNPFHVTLKERFPATEGSRRFAAGCFAMLSMTLPGLSSDTEKTICDSAGTGGTQDGTLLYSTMRGHLPVQCCDEV